MSDDTALVLAEGEPMITALAIADDNRASRIARAVAGWLDENSNSARTLVSYRGELLAFATYLQAHGMALDGVAGDIAQALQLWVKRAGKHGRRAGGDGEQLTPPTPATIAQRRATISSFYAYAVRMQLIASNPVLLMGKARGLQQYRSATPIKPATLKKRLAAIDRATPAGKRDYALLAIGVSTGRRLSELAGLLWGDVYIDGEQVTVLWPRCKGGKSTRDELPAATARALLAWRGVAMMQAGTLAGDAPVWVSLASNQRGHRLSLQAIADICERHTGTSKVHTLRHTFAHLMADAGAAPNVIQDRLLHSSLATTSRYLQALSSGHNEHGEQVASLAGID